MTSESSKSTPRGASFRIKNFLNKRKSQSSVSSAGSMPSKNPRPESNADVSPTGSFLVLPTISPITPNDSISRLKSRIKEHTRPDSEDDDDLDLDEIASTSTRSTTSVTNRTSRSLKKLASHKSDSSAGARSTTKPKTGTGILESLMHSFNLRSQTNLHENPPTLSPSGEQERHQSPSPVENIEFKPIKTSVLSSLGKGSLTLDYFPKPAGSETQEPPFSAIGSDSTNRTNANTLVDPPTTTTQPTSPNTNTPVEETPSSSRNLTVARRTLSPTSIKKSVSANALYTLSSHNNSSILDEEGATHNRRSRQPRERRRLTVSDTAQLSRHTTNIVDNEEDLEARKKRLAEQLDIKLPSQKRQDSFHQMFPEIPPSEIFIEDYTCAYRKDVLIHGRLYVSENHLSFHSNLIGLITHFTITLSKVLTIKKKKTVGIPNALEFGTLHDKYTFASFISRDSTYELLVKIWSSLLSGSNLNTVDLDFTTSEVDSDDPESEESDDPEAVKMSRHGTMPSKTIKTTKESFPDSGSDSDVSDKENMITDDEPEFNDNSESRTFRGIPYDGPLQHEPTSNAYSSESGDVEIVNDMIPAPVGAVYSLLFGHDTTFLKNLLKTQKNTDISEIPAFDETTKKRTYSYTKPLNGPVGPKQTKCNVEEEIERCDLSSSCLVTQITDTPDVPSGNSFRVKTRIYLSWGENNCCKIYIVTSVVWSGKSWIKGAVEKGTISGQKESLGIMVKELKKRVEAETPVSVSIKKRRSISDKKRKEVEVREELPAVSQTPAQPLLKERIIAQLDLKTVLLIVLILLVLWDKLTGPDAERRHRALDNQIYMTSEADLWNWIDQRQNGLSTNQNLEIGAQQLNEVIKVVEKRLDGLKSSANK
ncbi:hypothetical protein KL928_000483 [Ogataea angusta]|uniref:VASt domain-containing protein n=1 Tax=Pichia angusta TaxID=870730 RepID=A0AAN6I990_PICAN|nr:uncharacterized protein KL928_000483 [Ogataea angusta]KAG7822008.1 hypothetical protein KL928_000483 [Ogataea angusta]